MSDVFISHSSKDKEIADGLVEFLESRGISCWIAPRNIVPGNDWAASISTAITASKVFLVVYSDNSSKSEQCARELSIAEAANDVIVVPYKVDNTELVGAFQYYLTGSHWITANYKKKDYKYEELTSNIAGFLGKNIQTINANTYIDHLHIGNAKDLPEGIADAMKSKIVDVGEGTASRYTKNNQREDTSQKKPENNKTDHGNAKKSKTPIIIAAVGVSVLVIAVVLLIVLSSNPNGVKSVIEFLKTEGTRDETNNGYCKRNRDFSLGDDRSYDVLIEYYEDDDYAYPLQLFMSDTDNKGTGALIIMCLKETGPECKLVAYSDKENRSGKIVCYYDDLSLFRGQITAEDMWEPQCKEDESLSKQEFINLVNSLLPTFKKCMSEYLDSSVGVDFSEIGFSKWK